MSDKEKRLRKILVKRGLKGKLKSVATLEEAIIIIAEDPSNKGKTTFYNKRGYELALSREETFSEELVYFTVPTNPRNMREITRSIITKSSSSLVMTL